MSKPRKKWEPAYRFGGNPAAYWSQKPLGENQDTSVARNKSRKRKR